MNSDVMQGMYCWSFVCHSFIFLCSMWTNEGHAQWRHAGHALLKFCLSFIHSFVKHVEPCRASTAKLCRACTAGISFVTCSLFNAGNWCLQPHLAVPAAAVRWPGLAGGLLEAGARQRGTLQSPALKYTQHSLVTLTVGLEWRNHLMVWTETCTHICACMHIHIHANAHAHTHRHTHVQANAQTHTHMHTNAHAQPYPT